MEEEPGEVATYLRMETETQTLTLLMFRTFCLVTRDLTPVDPGLQAERRLRRRRRACWSLGSALRRTGC